MDATTTTHKATPAPKATTTTDGPKPKFGLLVKRGQFSFFYECERHEIGNRVQECC